jgi:hypothetical protein
LNAVEERGNTRTGYQYLAIDVLSRKVMEKHKFDVVSEDIGVLPNTVSFFISVSSFK